MLKIYWDYVKTCLRKQEGQGMVEYGLILALIALVAIGALQLMGTNVTSLFTGAADKLK